MAVPAIINLQAVTFALGEIDQLTREGERAVALDKSEIIIRSATGQLHALWRGEPLPNELVALMHDAGVAMEVARGDFAGLESSGTVAPAAPGGAMSGAEGIEWRVTEERLIVNHPGELVARLQELQFEGDLWVPTPGVAMFRGAPAAFAREVGGGRPDEHVLRAVKEFLVDVSRPEPVASFRQVYRQFDFAAGRAVRDLVAPVGPSIPAGQALLVPAIRGGREVGVTLPPRKSADIPAPEVVFQDVPADAD